MPRGKKSYGYEVQGGKTSKVYRRARVARVAMCSAHKLAGDARAHGQAFKVVQVSKALEGAVVTRRTIAMCKKDKNGTVRCQRLASARQRWVPIKKALCRK